MSCSNDPRQEEGASSWTSVIWPVVVALIGFGFAIYRYMQFSGAVAAGESLRITRIEMIVYKIGGQWGVIGVFVLMGIVGMYYAWSYYRDAKRNERP